MQWKRLALWFFVSWFFINSLTIRVLTGDGPGEHLGLSLLVIAGATLILYRMHNRFRPVEE